MKTDVWGAVATVVLCVLVACSDDGLDGPEREEFDRVDDVILEVEHGEVTFFASSSVEGAIVDRWSSDSSDFDILTQRESGGELVVDARCMRAGQCRTRYDLAVRPSTDIDAHLESGEVTLNRIHGEIRAVVDEGSVNGHRLQSPYVDVTVVEGSTRLHFDESPGELRLRLGTEGAAIVEVPDRSFRCDFDEDAESITMGDVECHQHAGTTIRVQPSTASVRFEVVDPAR